MCKNRRKGGPAITVGVPVADCGLIGLIVSASHDLHELCRTKNKKNQISMIILQAKNYNQISN
jgi:hypothetical protein